MTQCFSKAGLAAGTTTTCIKTTATVNYAINGVWQTAKAATDNIALTSIAAYPLAANTTGYIGVYLDTAGAFAFSPPYAGKPLVDRGNSVTSDVLLPYCFIGYVKVVTTAVFTPGTTVIGTGNTCTYVDCIAPPHPGSL